MADTIINVEGEGNAAPESEVSSAVKDAVAVLAVAEQIADQAAPDSELLDICRSLISRVDGLFNELAAARAEIRETRNDLSAQITALQIQEMETQDEIEEVQTTVEETPPETVVEETTKIEIPPETSEEAAVVSVKSRKPRWI